MERSETKQSQHLEIASLSLAMTQIILHTHLVKEINGLVVGFANFGHTRDEDKNSNVTAEITSIYLNPEHWRKGLGKELFQFILLEIKNKEFTEVTLWVIDTNQTACSFYQKMGLKPDGTTKIDIREDFELREIRYSKNLI
ncbi:MAG: GNAT family N-acetyltransferase [Cyanobacteriota bacterium]|nr:GNAT family N-acetyltransferase [Cyanobacteriota bacterium]